MYRGNAAAILKLYPLSMSGVCGRLVAYPPNLAKYTAIDPYICPKWGRYIEGVDLTKSYTISHFYHFLENSMTKNTPEERAKNFITSVVSPDVLFDDPFARNKNFTSTTPQLPPSVTYDKKSVRFTIPEGKPLNIKAELYGIKASSVFLSMVNDPRYIQLYKGEAGSSASRTVRHHYIDPLPYDQEYILTTASKDTPGRESAQPWWNAHPLYAKPRTDVFNKKSVWETDDSRDPGRYPNITVTWYHDNYGLNFEPITK